MVQVKVFQEKTSDLKVFQGAVNQFLRCAPTGICYSHT